MGTVLVIDDSNLDRKIARDSLSSAGFEVQEAADGREGLRMLYQSRPDLVLLDVIMPEMDGWTVCGRIRELCDVPIILLTSLNSEEEMTKGLNLGADDFVAKPISPAHLTARIGAVLRRAQAPAPTPPDAHYDDGTLLIDAGRHEVRLKGTLIDLTPTEFRLLLSLAAHPGRVHIYSSLLSTIWGPEYANDIDFLRVYVWRLRKKLEEDPGNPRWLINERGFGYRFQDSRR
jgi:two-component system KDP operon response regulator KdpE